MRLVDILRQTSPRRIIVMTGIAVVMLVFGSAAYRRIGETALSPIRITRLIVPRIPRL